MTESGRKNSDNGVRIIVKPKAAAKHARIRAIGAPPQAVADYYDWSEPEREILRTKQPSDLGSRSQHGKVVGAGHQQLETLRMLGSREIHAG